MKQVELVGKSPDQNLSWFDLAIIELAWFKLIGVCFVFYEVFFVRIKSWLGWAEILILFFSRHIQF